MKHGFTIRSVDWFLCIVCMIMLFPYSCCRVAGASGINAPETERRLWVPGEYYPPWSTIDPVETIDLYYNPTLTDIQNGALLASAINGLTPGQKLRIGPGTFSVNSWFTVEVQGTVTAPIWITAMNMSSKPVITRPDANQNVMNIGVNNPTEYTAFTGLEITGGSTLIKIYDVSNVWIDQCHIHHGAGVGIAANSADTSYVYITRNEIHHPGGPGDTSEGMYLGGNNGSVVMSHSIIALNHVHDTGGTQGDGIELKQGSYDNWIVENLIHDCNYPCLILYGTYGNSINLVERNVLYSSNDNTLQVQGEAVVRNNLIMDAAGAGFSSHDHQDQTLNLTFVHNTVINTGRAVNLSSWNSRVGMVFANNVLYSQSAESVRFPNGYQDVTFDGNVVLGTVVGPSTGYMTGTSLSDFINITWDATGRDGTPSELSPIRGAGIAPYTVTEDINGWTRQPPLDSGAFDADLLTTIPALTGAGGGVLIVLMGVLIHIRRKRVKYPVY